MSFVASKIQQTCTGTGNDNSKSTKQGMNHDYGWSIITQKFVK